MKPTIIFVHPWNGSYNAAILKTILDKFEAQKIDYQLIDLYRDNFNPALSKKELSLYSVGGIEDELVAKYQAILENTNKLILVFPIWWYESPAMFKGFIDKVMLKGFSYEENNAGLIVGKLTHIQKAVIITTSTAPKWFLICFAGNYINKILIKQILKAVGIKKCQWYNIGCIKKLSDKVRLNHLNKISKMF